MLSLPSMLFTAFLLRMAESSLLNSTATPDSNTPPCNIQTFQKILDNNGTAAQVVYAAHYAENSTFQSPNETDSIPTNLPATCAVQVNATTGFGTHYSFGLFLPDDWNGRFFQAAQEGSGIDWLDMAVGLRYGFAAVGSDTGHIGSDMDGTWWQNPESLNDWGWRANHLASKAGKLLAENFYNQKISYSYFAGCSTGGRQAMKESQMFPDDYDGIIAACPPWWTTHQQLWNLKGTTFQAPAGSAHTIPNDMFSVIANEVLRQCDAQDGLVDSIISDPFRCNFDYRPLMCGAGHDNETVPGCLTAPQIETLHKIYTDWIETNDTFIYTHMLYGSEAMWNESGVVGDGGNASIASQYWFLQHMLGLSNFTYEDLDFAVLQYADAMDPGESNANNFDLAPFARHGSKLIHYHGHSDAIVPPGMGIYFYDHVSEILGAQGIDIEDFYRFFLIPGMEHCYSTPSTMDAPWYIAGPMQATSLSSSLYSVPGYSNSEHDILLALVNWVENGHAPDQIIGSHLTNSAGYKINKQRPICAYPKQAKYKGKGDINEAANFECKLLY